MKTKVFVCAEKIIVDFQTKKVSAVNILEDLGARNFPIAIQFEAYLLVEKEALETVETFYLIVSIGETQLTKIKLNISFGDGQNVTKSIVTSNIVVVQSAGELIFSIIKEDGTSISKNIINIVFTPLLQSTPSQVLPTA